MNARFFLDTNIFVYSLEGGASAKARRSIQLIRQAIATRNGIVSFQVVQEFFNVALRRFVPPMTLAEAEQYLATVFRPLVAVHSSHALYAAALDLRNRYRLSGITPSSSLAQSRADAPYSTVRTCSMAKKSALCRLRILSTSQAVRCGADPDYSYASASMGSFCAALIAG